jgi:hypothetical protein
VASSGGFAARPPEPVADLDVPEETRELRDVTIRVRETRPGFFEATLRPTSPETHLARNGYTLDTGQGLRGRTLRAALDRAEAHWRQNYPSN